nr:unnamed protein product [Callosobruchus analis]
MCRGAYPFRYNSSLILSASFRVAGTPLITAWIFLSEGRGNVCGAHLPL